MNKRKVKTSAFTWGIIIVFFAIGIGVACYFTGLSFISNDNKEALGFAKDGTIFVLAIGGLLLGAHRLDHSKYSDRKGFTERAWYASDSAFLTWKSTVLEYTVRIKDASKYIDTTYAKFRNESLANGPHYKLNRYFDDARLENFCQVLESDSKAVHANKLALKIKLRYVQADSLIESLDAIGDNIADTVSKMKEIKKILLKAETIKSSTYDYSYIPDSLTIAADNLAKDVDEYEKKHLTDSTSSLEDPL